VSLASIGNRKGYAGYEFDGLVERYHVRHRVYVPEIGRWTRRDPIGYVDGVGLYQYVQARPVGSVDPTGLAPCDTLREAWLQKLAAVAITWTAMTVACVSAPTGIGAIFCALGIAALILAQSEANSARSAYDACLLSLVPVRNPYVDLPDQFEPGAQGDPNGPCNCCSEFDYRLPLMPGTNPPGAPDTCGCEAQFDQNFGRCTGGCRQPSRDYDNCVAKTYRQYNACMQKCLNIKPAPARQGATVIAYL